MGRIARADVWIPPRISYTKKLRIQTTNHQLNKTMKAIVDPRSIQLRMKGEGKWMKVNRDSSTKINIHLEAE